MTQLTRREALALGASAVPLMLTSSTSAAGQGLDPAAVDALLEDLLKAWRVPGVAVGIVTRDKVLHLKGYGVRELGKPQPVTPDTLFAIGSCTKAFTTTALAMLVDEGKLHWDEPVRRHVEYFRLADPFADGLVTLRDLLSHRTGVGSHDLLWYRAPWGIKESIQRAGLLAPAYLFRSGFQYQNVMVRAAGVALENASGMSWQDFVRRRILDPLDLKAISFTTAEALKADDHAAAHRLKDGKPGVIPWYPNPTPDPAGSINACARDLARWAQFHLGDGAFPVQGGTRLVSAVNFLETHAPQTILRPSGFDRAMQPETLQMSYGLGWVIQDYGGELLVSHAGALDGMRTHITLMPNRGYGLVFVNNLENTDMNLAASNTLVDMILGRRLRDWKADLLKVTEDKRVEKEKIAKQREALRHKGTKPSRELKAYAGLYAEPAYGVVQVTLEEGNLSWHWGAFEGKLEHFHYDTFSLEHERLGTQLVNFSLGADGEVATMHALERFFGRVPQR